MALAERAAGRYAAVVAAGGDGVVHEVANGLLRASGGSATLPMGILPLGRGNDFVKMLASGPPGARRPPDWRDAVKTIAGGRSILIDVGRMTLDGSGPGAGGAARCFVNVMDLGFGAETILNLARLRGRVPRRLAYLAADRRCGQRRLFRPRLLGLSGGPNR
jgi:diacylglycerol kinase family enzyme